jgi:hypothetical protein
MCTFYINGVKGMAEQFGLQNPTVRVRPKKGLLWELVFDSYTSHLYKVKIYKIFYEQVFTRFIKSQQETPFKHWKRYIPTSRKARVLKPPLWCSYKIHHRRLFFLRVVYRKKEEKSSTDELPTRKVLRFTVEFFVLQFAQFKESEGFFCDKLHTRAAFHVS